MSSQQSIKDFLLNLQQQQQQLKQQQITQQISNQYLEQNRLRMEAPGGLEEMNKRIEEKGKGGIIKSGEEEGKLIPVPTIGTQGKPKEIQELPIYKVAKNWADLDKLQKEEKAKSRKEGRKPNYSLIKRPGFVPPKPINLRVDYAKSIPNVIRNPDYDEFFAGRNRVDTKEEYEKNKNEVWQGDFYSYEDYVKKFNIKSKPFILNPKFDTNDNNIPLTSKVETINPLGRLDIEKKNEIISKLGGNPTIVLMNKFPIGQVDKKLSNIPNTF